MISKFVSISVSSIDLCEPKIKVVDSLELAEIKTKAVVAMLNAFEAKKAIIVTADVDAKMVKSANNIEGVATSFVGALNVYELLKADQLIIAKDAVTKLQEVYA